LNATDSAANFLLLDFQNKKRADDAWKFLGKHGFILRQMGAYGLDSYLRLTIGTASTNRKVLRLLKQFQES
jgi:histidinol-phosphate aminotransferase